MNALKFLDAILKSMFRTDYTFNKLNIYCECFIEAKFFNSFYTPSQKINQDKENNMDSLALKEFGVFYSSQLLKVFAKLNVSYFGQFFVESVIYSLFMKIPTVKGIKLFSSL